MNTIDTASSQGFGSLISHFIGWAYFIAWSASFYPQAILNYRRKSVQGLSLDFIYLNVFGFLCYSIFNLTFFFSSEVQEEYRKRNGGQDNLVRANDVFFAVHALILSSLTLFQTFIYKRNESQKISNPAKLLVIISTSGVLIVLYSVTIRSSQWIDLLYYLSYIKLGISFIKYCPQVYLNYSAQSTVGWSVHNVLLDFTGGVLSITQLILDAALSGDWSGISGDPVKFGLGLLSILFDLVFITQHYIFYRNREDFYAPLSMAENNGNNNNNGINCRRYEGKQKALLLPIHRNYLSTQNHQSRMKNGSTTSRPASMRDLEMGIEGTGLSLSSSQH
ncbi:hypothetical protein BX616_000446 [Lobosporangium transversale]|uniref:PQ loop repeat-domain-containing protein n=1 Tax=Lobosporangium transversale TaxID=64571 RepID=A0A1Y2GNI0_9FUNG|nr:PQ loop repeat-domain-containing protein [Lobosporangium transversale]KAF9917611.1 hypothetical protein BX616_000446 [Lobosporangium transversale]ORZ16669.1 PQ loop repeat-domain-containing protein [Lobosporangium transversale]|eukprot:XP_021881604.1 PQ loop repeat-domain-containing protein [Lobosporangium transversale]